MGWGHLKIFFSKITGPEELKFTRKLFDILENQVIKNHGPWGLGGATIGETVFTNFYIRNIFRNLLLNNHRTRKVVNYIEASKHKVD
jgi:hypothetical protein